MNFEVQYLGHSILALFGFSFFITHHSSLNFRHSSFITHHLKYPNFPNPTRLAHVFSFLSLNFFYFLWDHTWAPYQTFLLAYPPHTISSFHITHCSFPFQFNPQYSPKTKDFNPGIHFFFFPFNPQYPQQPLRFWAWSTNPKNSLASLKHLENSQTHNNQFIAPIVDFIFYFLFFLWVWDEKGENEEKKKEKKRREPRNPVKRNGKKRKKKCNQIQKPNVKRKEKKEKKKRWRRPTVDPMWKGKEKKKKE